MISNEIREVLQQVAATLNKHQVEYLVVGGIAVRQEGSQSHHG